MNWKEERANKGKDYCGYCDGYVTRCDSSCFTDERFNPEENKIDHLFIEIAKTEERLQELKQEYINTKYEHKKA